MTLLLTLLLLSGQDPVPDTAAGQAGWIPLNNLALVVNEKGVTAGQIQQTVLRLARDRNVARNDVEALRQLQMATVGLKAREMLEEQGGQDLGFEPDQVRAIVADQLQREEDRAGSISVLAEYLAAQEIDSGKRRTEVQGYVYRRLYSEALTGKGAGPTGRPSVDAFVRPGRLWFEHTEATRGLADERQVKITQLIVSTQREGGPEAARTLASVLRDRVLQGEDMGDLCEEFGSAPPGTRGASEFLPLGGLRRYFPDVYEFVAPAKIGDLSPVLPYEREGELVAYIVVRIDEWNATEPSEFNDRDYQRSLRARFTQELERLRIAEGLELLARAAYVWPPGALGGPSNAPKPAAEPESPDPAVSTAAEEPPPSPPPPPPPGPEPGG